MAIRGVTVDHALLKRLRQLDKEAARRFPWPNDPGFGAVGLILNSRLDEFRYDWCTPTNCRPFGHTGGDGTHFSLLVRNGRIDEDSPVVMTVPGGGMGASLIVGETLFDFLCLGKDRGFFALEQLSYNREAALEAYTNPESQAADHERQLLEFMSSQLELRAWGKAERFDQLQERYEHLLEFPPEGTLYLP